MSCANFWQYIYIAGFGNTAGAMNSVNNPNPDFSNYPSVVLGGDQAVLQFKTAAAATSFYNQAYAKFKQCTAFTVPDPADNTQYELTLRSLSKTTVGKNKAFQVIQLDRRHRTTGAGLQPEHSGCALRHERLYHRRRERDQRPDFRLAPG